MIGTGRRGRGIGWNGRTHHRAVILCVAVLVLIGVVAASVAFADPAPDGGAGPLQTLPSSKVALAEATAGAVPVAMPEPPAQAPAPSELENLGRPEAEGVLQGVFGSAVEGAAQALDELEIEDSNR